ncbi:MAG TPA: hypothetical protein VNO75_10165 [Gemmatimonadaceae bacterium]|nr:hypothetical protein [Gemmatimonadaceae bacterium]
MRIFLVGTVLASVAVVGSCTPAGQSSADSAAAASSTPVGVGIAIPDSAALAAAARTSSTQRNPGASQSSTKSPVGSTSGSTTKPQKNAPIVRDDIVGRDSVIRFPARVAPRASSTPPE